MPIEVKVTNIRAGGLRKNVIATARVELTSQPDTVIICDARLQMGKYGLFVAYPRQSVGRGEYVATIEFSKGLKIRISDAVLAAHAEFRKDQTACGPGHIPEFREASDPYLDPKLEETRGQSDGR